MALLPCPECGHQISDKAPSCPQCGVSTTNRTGLSGHSAQKRKVGLLLALGIMFIPFPLALLTLRNGYGTWDRTWSLGWLGFIFLIMLGASEQTEGTRTTRGRSAAVIEDSVTERTRKGGINRETYAKIQNYMTKSEVRELLGEPESISETSMPGVGTTELWHYQKNSLMGSAKAIEVWFENDRVTGKNWVEI